MVSGLAHLGGNHGKVAAIFPQKLDEMINLLLGPVSHIFLGSFDDFLLFFVDFVVEGDFVDEGGESADG